MKTDTNGLTYWDYAAYLRACGLQWHEIHGYLHMAFRESAINEAEQG